MFWRSFTHWIGGMGVLVLTLALVPQLSERTSHLVKAESPGPTLSKIVPKMGDTAKIFYIIYLILTILEFIVLMIAGMNPYDAAIHAMGTAGTGGFSNYAASVGAFASPVIDVTITVFMVMFGINFALYYCAITGNWRGIVKSEELRWYLGIFLTVTAAITMVILPRYGTVGNALRYASFQVASIMSTTGYATADSGSRECAPCVTRSSHARCRSSVSRAKVWMTRSCAKRHRSRSCMSPWFLSGQC